MDTYTDENECLKMQLHTNTNRCPRESPTHLQIKHMRTNTPTHNGVHTFTNNVTVKQLHMSAKYCMSQAH